MSSILKKIDQIPFHDAIIKGINIQTQNDHFDELSITLESDNFLKLFDSEMICVCFSDCFKAQFNLQMWVEGFDSVRLIDIFSNSKWLEEVRNANQLFGDILNDLKHVYLELNISNSQIDILAKDIKINPIK